MVVRILVCVLLIPLVAFSQNRNSIWCFGDSAGIDFNNLNSPVSFVSGMDGRGTCTSIADSSGQLLFYGFTRAGTLGSVWSGQVYNRNHELMINGDSIQGEGWYNEMTIVPFPGNNSLYYLFSIHVSLPPPWSGLHYSVIDMTQDSGNGAVVLKNVQVNPLQAVDGVCAIKHGNGRDWWLIFKDYDFMDNNFRLYLISPTGVNFHHSQQIGGINSTNNANLTFSPINNKILFTAYTGLIETLDFDRCTGYFSNPVIIDNETFGHPVKRYWGSTFSPDGDKIYVSKSDSMSYLFQYDLTAPDISASKDTLYVFNNVIGEGGGLRLAPNGKIYLSNVWYDGTNFNYPYPSDSTAYNFINMNLGVINSPDSLGISCDFQPYSFHLGGKRTYWGLPNNPNYDLPADSGSICDSLTVSMNEVSDDLKGELFVYYNPDWQTVFINAQKLENKQITLTIYDLMGKVIYTETTRLSSQYFTKDLVLQQFSTGLYIVSLQTASERLVKDFIKY